MVRRVLKILLSLTLVFSAACGKNDGFRQVGSSPYSSPLNGPIYQAPPPQNGGFLPPGNFGGQYPSQYFNPTMPPGYPPQYTPFLPIDNYMRNTPPMQNYWQNHWQGWQNYSQTNNIYIYNFPKFWLEYCPQQWQGTQLEQVYNEIDVQAYYWVDEGTQFGSNLNYSSFWQDYAGMPFDSFGCGGGCY